ncbi:MAG: ATP-binding protein [Pseudomonadota bacterium]
MTSPAFAQTGAADNSTIRALMDMLPNQNMANSWVMLIIFVGAFAFAMWSATWLIRERRQLENANTSMAMELADLRARHERAQALLDVPDQRVVIWEGRNEAPVCRGVLPESTGAPMDTGQFTAFGSWMNAASAQSFENALHRLRERAEGFDMAVETRAGSVVEVQGRASGSHAFVRFLNLDGDRAALAALEAQHTNLVQTTDTMQALMEGIPFPVWLRNGAGDLTWANSAYVQAVDSEDLTAVLNANTQLLDEPQRRLVSNAHAAQQETQGRSVFNQRLPATISGDRRMVDVSEVAHEGGSAGLAVDMSEVEEVQAHLRRTLESHAQTMNQLATAVAIFDEKRHLIFHNAAFENLWKLERGLLEAEPDNGQLFDAMRDAGQLAEQPDWSKWRNGLLTVYEETQPQEHWWHLPDGRTLRVIANPHKQGGVTWVFENVTEQLEMESRYIALTKVQGETLDHLSESIAVFAPDGRLKLSNPPFQKLWQLSDEDVAANTRIADIAALCRPLMERPEIWDDVSTAITGISDTREPMAGQLALRDGTVCDYALVPLPNGQAMLSFMDVTAMVHFETTLKERNEALVAAEKLKNEFIEHVSYEFRAPLTSIMGFAEMLQQQHFGPLNERQLDYVADISGESKTLHELVDNLLDLATVDAGIMELEMESVDTRALLRRVAREMTDRLHAKDLKISIRQSGGAAQFTGDARRIEQIINNLVSNAIVFSPEGETITLESATAGDGVRLAVIDNGPGVPEGQRGMIFDRFNSASKSSGKRGAGLGLSIARALVELHGGTIKLDSVMGEGTRFECFFPHQRDVAEPVDERAA